MSIRAVLILVVISTAVTAAALLGGRQPGTDTVGSPRYFHVDGTIPEFDAADLVTLADAIAVIEPIGTSREHWNSADNTPWALEDVGLRSHILRDQDVTVDATVKGSVPGSFVLRGFGGTVRDISVEYDDEPTLEAGHRYLAFLRNGDIPTRDGVESSWFLLYQQHGLFTLDQDGVWVNPAGFRINEDEIGARSP